MVARGRLKIDEWQSRNASGTGDAMYVDKTSKKWLQPARPYIVASAPGSLCLSDRFSIAAAEVRASSGDDAREQNRSITSMV